MDFSNVSHLINSASDYWHNEWILKSDPRTAGWLFCGSPAPMLTLLFSYLAFVVVGPIMMKNRKPFELRTFMAIYNMVLVIVSAYMVYEFFFSTWHLPNRYCTATDFSDDPQAVRLAKGIWVAYMTKGIEFLDTVIFILRKKDNQVTFLHVYHHAVILVVAYVGIKWYPGGITWFWQCCNAGIHTVMYFYYFMSGLGPQFQPYLWWKKYLTSMQILQFVAGLVVIAYSFLAGCDHPTEWRILMATYLGSLFVLFSMFYVGKYKPTKRSKKE